MAASVYRRFGSVDVSAPVQNERQHTVIGGETLPGIAALEFTTGYDSELWRQLAEGNGITDLDAVRAGQVLRVPQPASTDD